MMAVIKETKVMAVVEVRGYVMLPVEDAVQLVNCLANAERLEYLWSEKTYKRYISDDGVATIKVLSSVDVARIALADVKE